MSIGNKEVKLTVIPENSLTIIDEHSYVKNEKYYCTLLVNKKPGYEIDINSFLKSVKLFAITNSIITLISTCSDIKLFLKKEEYLLLHSFSYDKNREKVFEIMPYSSSSVTIRATTSNVVDYTIYVDKTVFIHSDKDIFLSEITINEGSCIEVETISKSYDSYVEVEMWIGNPRF